jgi:hypothetical protein
MLYEILERELTMSFSGTWYNELGSKMSLAGSGGSLSGTYVTAVGTASGTYTLQGRYNTQPSSGGQAMGWTVAWQNAFGNSHSATAWSGQYQTVGGQEEIVTLWLLVSETYPQDDWGSTKVGQDVFTRQPPTPQTVARKLQAGATSHPVKPGRWRQGKGEGDDV